MMLKITNFEEDSRKEGSRCIDEQKRNGEWQQPE